MAKHIFKIVWNRKGTNALISLEIFVSFLVVFGVVLFGTELYWQYRKPLGFDYENIWDVGINTGASFIDGGPEDMSATLERLMTEVEAFDQVEGTAVSVFGAYSDSSMSTDWGESLGMDIESEYMKVTPEYLDVMGLELLAGRWFEPGDQHVHWRPVVITTELAEEAFGTQDPVGKVVVQSDDGEEEEYRVIGVAASFRRLGEYQRPRNVMFAALWPDSPVRIPIRRLQVKVASGTPLAFEEEMVKTLRAVAPDWTFTVKPLTDRRESYLRGAVVILSAVGLIALFLMLMVGLGLVGVLWQNVTQRVRELGLRRAKGATARNIHRQILAELLMVATLAIAVAAVLAAQVMILGLVDLEAEVFTVALLLTIAVLYVLTCLCGFYPSWLATRIQPAEALHYE